MKNILSLLKVAPHAKPLEDPALIQKTYKHFRFRILYSMIVGYALYYFVRANFAMAMPVFLKDLGFTKTDMGIVLTLFSVVYGFGKFANGVLADRTNSRYLMAIGLFCAGLVNVFFGLSSGITAFAIFWLLNAWFQSYGMPASVRLLTHWYSPTELGTKWGLQSTAHQIGGAGIMILAGFLIPHFGWRYAFYVPGVMAMITSFWLLNRLRDTPQSIGLPPVEEFRGEGHITDPNEDQAKSFKEIMVGHILKNRFVWIVATANIFIYIVRIGIMSWAPTFLVETRGSSLASAGLKTAGFELAGIVGAIGAGWISDRVFKGRRAPLAVVSMFFLILALVGLWLAPNNNPYLDAALLIAAGVLVYGPQLLVPVAAAEFASKKAASTATGITGAFGYFGSALAGVGTGVVVDKWGWDGGFIFFIASAVIGMFLFMGLWNHRAPQLERFHNSKKAAA
ncbi:MAG: MFS transporter [Deltaproteobacteria bacterium]|nr:MFS transporter [Deltaproteobacteria bacterium]